MSELGKIYQQATETVLNRYRSEKDKYGRSQQWKFDSVEEYRKNGKDSSTNDIFVGDVEKEVSRIISDNKSLDKKRDNEPSGKKKNKKKQPEKIEVKPPIPHNNTPDNPLWNN